MAQTLGSKAYQGLGDLIKLLPTGTVFLFHFLNRVLTDNGHCSVVNKVLSGVLLGICGFSCAFSCFTDSYTGLWPFWDPKSSTTDLSNYRLRLGDFVHAALSVLVFAIVGLLDSNTVSCYYPSFESKQKVLLMVLPPAIGTLVSASAVIFPNNRHGIGYPASPDTVASSSSTSE
ncbi:unnamed protein product [Spirodela intermedia]|uniref:Uncharacterized protein n=1 Tax=Spirodela intermedia TaxID=51605 RepID=A0A7I8I982_SPIIN|nr:unnamed protein product [Spirodela intermedia]CAA6654170.1 unnamed protein product [Spirodela intermedia]